MFNFMEQPILSPYTFLFENGGDHYVFNSESLFFSKIGRDLFVTLSNRDFQSLDEDAIETLRNKRIIIEEKDRYTCYNHLLTRHLTSAYSDDTMVLIIAPTTGCNFECPYCFEPKKNPKSMTPEVVDKLIQYINKQDNIKHISLTWYGGEPLLMQDTIKTINDRICAETDKDITNQEIVSNTYLVTDKTIDIMRHCKINKIQVSVDGIEENHDKTRYLKSTHAPTFKVIERNIEKMAKELPDMHISIRVNINKSNWQDFVSLYLKYHGEEWHRNIGLYPGIIREDGADGRRLCHNCYRTSDMVELYLKFGKMGVNVNMFPGNRFKGCMLQRANAFIVGPEGELYKCWNDVSNPDKIIGSIMDNDLHNYDVLMRYMQECRPIREECRDCYIYPICDGGCGYLQYRNKFGNGEFELCSPFKDKDRLIKALLYSISDNGNRNRKNLNL